MQKILYGIPYLEIEDVNPDGSLKPHVGQGKPVLLMIQGDFCGYCTDAKPAFQELAQKARGVVLATVQIDAGPKDKAANQALKTVNTQPGVPAFLGFDSSGRFVGAHKGDRTGPALSAFAAQLK